MSEPSSTKNLYIWAPRTNHSLYERRRIIRRRWSRITSIVIFAVVLTATTLVIFRMAGFRAFTVMSGSMDPELPVGALVYVKPVDYQTLEVGDIVSYVADDSGTVVTHRIVDIEIDQNDESVWRFRTKGDANSAPDAKLVHYKNIVGTPIFMIPNLGYLAHSVGRPPGVYIALVVGTLLVAWSFLPGTLEGRRKIAKRI